MPDPDLDLERITKLAAEGLKESREQSERDGEEGLRLDNFIIVAVFLRDEDDRTVEETAVWCESRKHYMQVGLLAAGQARLDDEDEDAD
jgi:hypothetical protein